MNIRAYRARLERDLDRWIAAGLVPAESRAGILADLGPEPQGRTALWLGMTGAVLAGLAVVAAIADNWALIPRALKLGLLLALLWSAIGMAIWGERRGQAAYRNAGALLAALIFAAAVSLIGQALNIPGDPEAAVFYAALGAGALALAARSPAAGLVYLALAALWYGFDGASIFGSANDLDHRDAMAGLLLAAGFAGAALMPSRVLLHAALALAGPYLFFIGLQISDDVVVGYALALVWGLLGAIGVLLASRGTEGGRTLVGWSAWHGLLVFAIAGVDSDYEIAHRLVWLALSIGVIAVGARLKQGWVTAAAIFSLIGACFALMLDLGLSLSVAALIFGVAAVITVIAARALRGTKDGSEP